MSQAEIAAGKMTLRDELPNKGRRLPDFTLMSVSQTPVRLSDYRGRRNLVLLFAGGDFPRLAARTWSTGALVSEIVPRYAEFVEQEAEVLVIVQLAAGDAAEMRGLPFPVLLDTERDVHKRFGARNAQGTGAPALYITDRFGEVFEVYRTVDGQSLPTVDEVLRWLEFINHQCPECEPPEWPVS